MIIKRKLYSFIDTFEPDMYEFDTYEPDVYNDSEWDNSKKSRNKRKKKVKGEKISYQKLTKQERINKLSPSNQKKFYEFRRKRNLRTERLNKAATLRAKKAFAKNAKIGAGIVAGSAALGTGAYLYNKNKSKNSDSK